MPLVLLKKVIQIFFIIAISLAIVTIYPVFIFGSYIWLRLAVFFSTIPCWRRRGVFISPVRGLSAFLAPDNMFKSPNSTLVHVTVLKSTPEPEVVTRHLQSIYDLALTPTSEGEKPTKKYAKLGYCLEPWWGYMFWKEIEDFEIRNQITFVHNRGLDHNNVSTFVEEVIRKPFRRGQPLWEVFVVSQCPEKASPEEREKTECFVIFRTHHILQDGISIIRFWSAADSVGGQGGGGEVKQNQVTYKTSSTDQPPHRTVWQRFKYAMKIYIMSPYLSNKFVCTPGDDNVLMNFGYKEFGENWWCSGLNKIHLERYRQSLRDLGFTLTHALLVGYGRGLKKFITENYGVHQIPGTVHILGSIPRPPYPAEALTNHWAIMRYKADLTRRTLLEELVHAKTEYARAVHHIIPEAFEQIHKLGMDNIPYKLYDISWDTTKSGTLSLSNLPGPTTPQKMFDIPVTDRAVWLPLTRRNSGIGLLMLTYNGWGTISITADSGCIKTRKLFNHLNQSIMSEMQFVLDQVLRMSQNEVVPGPGDVNHNLSKLCPQEECQVGNELQEIKIV